MSQQHTLGIESSFGRIAISSDNTNRQRVTSDQSKYNDPHHKEAVANSGPFKGKFRCIPCKFTWEVSYATWPDIPEMRRCQHCDKGILPEMHLTPYQGKGRRYGGYHCKNCNKTWSSAGSWANSSQKCLKCNKYVYPKTQERLRGSAEDNTGSRGHHQEELCSKCQELGHSCISVAVGADDDDDDDDGSNAYTTHVHDDDDNDHDDYYPSEEDYQDQQDDDYERWLDDEYIRCQDDYDDQYHYQDSDNDD